MKSPPRLRAYLLTALAVGVIMAVGAHLPGALACGGGGCTCGCAIPECTPCGLVSCACVGGGCGVCASYYACRGQPCGGQKNCAMDGCNSGACTCGDYCPTQGLPCDAVTGVTISAPVDGSKYAFNDATPGSVSITCQASAVPNCRTADISWTANAIDGSQRTWNPNPPKGGQVTLTYTTLPSDNDQFGETYVGAQVGGKSDMKMFKVFFTGEDAVKNHPDPGAGTTPNWYYYWEQTSATYGTHDYDGTRWRSWTPFMNGAWRSLIGYGADETSPAGTWNGASGIDFYAHNCRHEERHRLDLIGWWGANDRTQARDPDADWIPTDDGGNPPTAVESSLSCPFYGVNYNPNQRLTEGIEDHFNYGIGLSDVEDYCLHRQQPWNNGDANDEDWSNAPYPKQW